MIFSSPFSKLSILIPTPNQPYKSSFPIASASMSSTTFPSSSSPATPTTPLPSPPSSLYEVLKIPMSATFQEVKVAYRKMARVCHPDVAKEAKDDEFIKIYSAYATLSDPEKRAHYDRRFATIRTSASSSKGPVYTRRKWETDQCW